jgi:AcrR family transcriptional regulator
MSDESTARWGDREGRRNDILRAAQAIVREKGVAGLNMREIARRAGVSPGASYFYYRNKEEIFLAVYADCVDELAVAAQQDCAAAASLDDLLRRFAATYLRFYRDYGRHLNIWSATVYSGNASELPPQLVDRLRQSVAKIFLLLSARMNRLATLENRRFREGRLTLPFLWMVFGGLVENFSGPRAEAGPFDWDEMVAFASDTLLRGLLE